MLILGKAESVLFLSTTGKNLPGSEGEENRIGGIPAGSPYSLGNASLYYINTVIVSSIDAPVMKQEVISDAAQSS